MKKLGRILTIYFKASEQVIKDIGEAYQYNFEKENLFMVNVFNVIKVLKINIVHLVLFVF